MSKWQPIETAPRGGTIIWLYRNKGPKVSRGPYIGWYRKGKWPKYPWAFLDDTEEFTTGCCDDEEQGRVLPNGWPDDQYGPTHWRRALPPNDPQAPPEQQRGLRMHTEDEARKLWCPFFNGLCMASDCGAWRWDNERFASLVNEIANQYPTAQAAADEIERSGRTPGYCGLAGRP